MIEVTASGMSIAISSNCAHRREPYIMNGQPIAATTANAAITTARAWGTLAWAVISLAKPQSAIANRIDANITSRTFNRKNRIRAAPTMNPASCNREADGPGS